MSVEQNKVTTRRSLEDVMNKGNVALIPDLFASNYVWHGTGGQEIKGHDGWRQTVLTFRTAFPDQKYTILQLIGEGDSVVCYYSHTGTQLGQLGAIAPSGKRLAMNGMFINRFENGKIAECWGMSDSISMYQQLGVTPPAFKQAEEKNKAMYRRMTDEMWNKRNFAIIPELYDRNFVIHSGGQDIRGFEALKQFGATFVEAFPDFVGTITDMVAEGDMVIYRAKTTGTHKREYMGIAPTGRKVTVLETVISRCVDGKEAEAWIYGDSPTLSEQLSAGPTKH